MIPVGRQSITSTKMPVQTIKGVEKVALTESVLIQKRPLTESIFDHATYDQDQIDILGPRDHATKDYKTPEEIKIVDIISTLEDVPVFIYRQTENGMIRYLGQDKRDLSYYDEPDPDYSLHQRWLLNTRQGDNFNRIPEWDRYMPYSDQERDNMNGFTTQNIGRVWYGPPENNLPPPLTDYQEYERYMDYYLHQQDDDN